MPYTAPTASQFKARFPTDFGSVADETIEMYIAEANRSVDETWIEDDYQTGIMYLAAHLMAEAGIGSGPDSLANTGQMANFQTIKSGQLTLTRGTKLTGGVDYGPYGGTRYGQAWWRLLKLNKGGPRVTEGCVGGVSGYAKDCPFWPWVYGP